MRRQQLTRCALVRFVHTRCGVLPKASAEAAEVAVVDCAGEPLQSAAQKLSAAVRRHRPIVLRGLPIPEACTGDLLPGLRELCGARQIPVRLPEPEAPGAVPDAALAASLPQGLPATFGNGRSSAPYSRREVRRVDEVLEELTRFAARGKEGATSAAPQKRVGFYVANVPVEDALPEAARCWHPLREMVGRLCGGRGVLGAPIPGTPVLYLGAGWQRTPLHFDPTENLTVVLQGTKIFRLFPPSASPGLQPHGGLLPALVCWLRGIVPAVYSGLDAWQLPLVAATASQVQSGSATGAPARPTPIEVRVHAGEVLYLPATWWHAVAGSAEPNVTLVFGFEPARGQ